MDKSSEDSEFISLSEATQHCSYSQEYLSLRARQGKLKAVKLGRNWATKKEWLEEYLERVKQYNENMNYPTLKGRGIPTAKVKSKKGDKKQKTEKPTAVKPPENLPVGDLISSSVFSRKEESQERKPEQPLRGNPFSIFWQNQVFLKLRNLLAIVSGVVVIFLVFLSVSICREFQYSFESEELTHSFSLSRFAILTAIEIKKIFPDSEKTLDRNSDFIFDWERAFFDSLIVPVEGSRFFLGQVGDSLKHYFVRDVNFYVSFYREKRYGSIANNGLHIALDVRGKWKDISRTPDMIFSAAAKNASEVSQELTDLFSPDNLRLAIEIFGEYRRWLSDILR